MSLGLDDDIARPLAAGDVGTAATAALERYGPQIHGYLVAVLRAHPAADDAFAQFAEDLWKGLPGFRGASSFRTWAYKLAWHAACRQQRDPYLRRGRRLRTSEASAIAERVSAAASRQARQDLADRVHRLRDALTPDERTLLVLKIDRELTWREVAEVLSTPRKKVDEALLRKRFERLTEKLRKLAIEQGLLEAPA
jgi:RNA polymerase sigma-70 factor (ECF subfamily)